MIGDLDGSGPVRVYAAAADVDDLLSDHGLREAGSDKIASAVIWVVDDLAVVPRSDADSHPAASIVAAVDLLDAGDPRAQAAARSIIENVLRGITR